MFLYSNKAIVKFEICVLLIAYDALFVLKVSELFNSCFVMIVTCGKSNMYWSGDFFLDLHKEIIAVGKEKVSKLVAGISIMGLREESPDHIEHHTS